MFNNPQKENENSQATSEKNSFAAPSLSLPKGGGAIRGVGEKFAANPVSGTGSMSVPIATSPGRSGFGPQLSLSYDSGSGNGPFGFGWNLSLPAITRKTDKGLPQYLDADESDVFILSGAEDLVPILQPNGKREIDSPPVQGYTIHRYRPRIEGLFALIERWSNPNDPSDVHWRSISRDNILTLYGKDENSRIFNPMDKRRIFSWLICESRDDKGNGIIYRYQEEDGTSLDLTQAHERNRGDLKGSRRAANRYIRSIKYGNESTLLDSTGTRPPVLSDAVRTNTNWMFEVVFDYDEGHYKDIANGQVQVSAASAWSSPNPSWKMRPDSFSTYRAGFEVRTNRRCRRVLMFHHVAALSSDPVEAQNENHYVGLVRSTDFIYSDDDNLDDPKKTVYSFIKTATQSSYQLDVNDTYHKRSLPPLEFTYTQPIVQETVHELQSDSLENLPVGIDGITYQWIDLDGEGLSGILTEQAGAWFYKRNLSPINYIGEGEKIHLEARFSPVELVAAKPAFTLTRQTQFLDLAGDGRPDVVQFDSFTPGFYERTRDEDWEAFVAFRSLPTVDWNNPNLKFIDLDGDGHADILISEDNVFTWHRSLAEEGFDRAEQVTQPWDEENGPRVVFADGTQSIYLSDMSGDGLTDIVRIRNGEVCYWPNLGYGHFGAKVTMDNSPWFDHPDIFDQKRIRLADIDGSGTVDILYLSGHQIDIYFNQCGNRWSESQPLTTFPRIDNLSSVQVLDLLGNGTACLVWGSPLPGDAGRPMRYIDLMGSQKPHLLTNVVNNLGAQTQIEYAPSTKFYVQDRLAGKPWITKLPFPVHCVERVTVIDHWRKTKFSTSYSYHHGYFDGVEREFRGFGRVEQVDVEDYNTFSAGNIDSPYITHDHTLYQPPIKTITWFHTGASLDRQRILKQFEGEYFYNRFPEQSIFAEKSLPEPDLAEQDLSAEEWREALRACKGMALRQEIYELDVDELHLHQKHIPVRIFSAASHNCHIDCVQPRGDNRHAVFLVTESEALTYNYELTLPKPGVLSDPLEPDPRIAHTLNLSFDNHGNPQQSIAVVYPRVKPQTYDANTFPAEQLGHIHAVQNEFHIAYTETHYTKDVIVYTVLANTNMPVVHYRSRLPYEVLTYELTGLADPTSNLDFAKRYFTIEYLRQLALSTMPEYGPVVPVDGEALTLFPLNYHERPKDLTPHQRLVEHMRSLYFDDRDGIGQPQNSLALGQHGPRGLKYEDYKLALTDALLDVVFKDAPKNKLDQPIEGTATARAIILKRPEVSGYLSGAPLITRFAGIDTAGQYWIRSGIAGFASADAQPFYLPERYTDPFDNITMLEYDRRNLYIKSSMDSLYNRTEITRFDFRVLAPYEMRDLNNNLTELLFDVMGMVIAVAVKGKGNQADSLPASPTARFAFANPKHALVSDFFNRKTLNLPQLTQVRDWLGTATTRFVYHFGEERDANGKFIKWADRPAGACGIQREIHTSQPGGAQSPLQIALECSDGAGNVMMKKVQAEPAPNKTSLRWIVNGKTVHNNKGNPVKQYEPYFSDDFGCTEIDEVGVTPLLYYDAAGRLIRTELPDGTYSRVEFSPWHVLTFDANDTILETGNAWYALNSATTASTEQRRAASLAANHANTPALTILDSLGREVMAIAHNRTPNTNGQWQDGFYTTFTRLDAEGKPLWIEDARGNLVMRYTVPAVVGADPTVNFCPAYDIAGNLLYQHSMDAGDRWMLMDAAGKPMFAWDDYRPLDDGSASTPERRLYFTEYDKLHRPVAQWLRINSDLSRMIERFKYLDKKSFTDDDELVTNQAGLDQARDVNLLGQLVLHYDPSGRVETIQRDFKGNVEEVHRRLNKTPQESLIDWKGDNPGAKLEAEIFVQTTEYDALNRMMMHRNWHRITPDDPIAFYVPAYNERGLLFSEQLAVRANRTDARVTKAISEIHYDAKGQKEYLVLGNGTITRYDYDPKTFRLRQLRTTRPAYDPSFPQYPSDLKNPKVLQQLHYTYDPVGNITEIYDEAYKPVFWDGAIIEPRSLYEYDALYRLISASGRETAQGCEGLRDAKDAIIASGFPITNQTLRRYNQTYQYDAVGNFVEMRHRVSGDSAAGWTRYYKYVPNCNRLLRTWEGDDDWSSGNATQKTTYHYDSHGNMLNLADVAQAQYMRWDHRDMIGSLDLGGGDNSAYYQYDAGKQRTRKQIVRVQNNVTTIEDRIYLGGYELYQRSVNGTVVEEIESHHLFEGQQRVLLVDDVLKTNRKHSNGKAYKTEPLFRYQYSNHLGSACLELDDGAEIISYEEYHPYGTSAYRAVRSGIEAPPKRYRYTGMERDEESGLNYNAARYYLLWLARWCSFDPSGFVGGINGYVAMNNSPMIFRDPNGRAPVPGIQPPNSGSFPSGTPNNPVRLSYRGMPRGPTPAPYTPSPTPLAPVGVGTFVSGGAMALGSGLLLLLAGMVFAGGYGANEIGEMQQSPAWQESVKFYARASTKSSETETKEHYKPDPPGSLKEAVEGENLRRLLSGEKGAVLPGVKGIPVSDPGEKGIPVSDPGEKGIPVSDPGEKSKEPALTPGASVDKSPMKFSGKERKELDMIRRKIDDLAAAAIGIAEAEGAPVTKGRFGTLAHGILETMIKRMNLELEAMGSKFRVRAEVFYDQFGNETSRRAKGSKGPDVQITHKGVPIENIDLKTGRGGSRSGLDETERRSGAPLFQVGPQVPGYAPP